jgi:CheY-like chemotaxis protein
VTLLGRLLAALPAVEVEVPRAVASTGGASVKVLCVDDSEPNLLLLERYLKRRGGVSFVPARDGDEALALAAAEHPDLILLDLHLPGLSGLDVLELLGADARTAAIPVVVVSADAHDEQIAAVQERGAHDYLVKPLDLARLGLVLDSLTSKEGER